MSIFSHIRRSRQQAKEHNAKIAEQRQKEQDAIPYKHVPTHAASDAIASAPPHWRDDDKPKIMEQNRRRSAMAATGHHMNMPGIPRVGSSLSHVSYPTNNANPMVRLPRAYSYNGVSPYPSHNRDVVYSVADVSYSHPPSLKGKEVPRGLGYDSPRVSPPSSKGGRSPVESVSGSSSSQDDLEMRPARPAARQVGAPEASLSVSSSAHRLHPTARRTSDSSNERHSTSNGYKTANTIRDSRPPTSMRGFSNIPTGPASNHGQTASVGSLYSTSGSVSASASVPASRNTSAAPSTTRSSSRQESSYTLSSGNPVSTRALTSAPATTAAASAATTQSEFQLNWVNLPGPELTITPPAVAAGPLPTAETKQNGDRRTSKLPARFQEVERSESRSESPYNNMSRADPARVPRPLAHADIVNMFPEEAPLPQEMLRSSKDKKKFGKSGGKLMKKNRWSLSTKSSPVAV